MILQNAHRNALETQHKTNQQCALHKIPTQQGRQHAPHHDVAAPKAHLALLLLSGLF
jgi:hypothetical protein